MFSKTIMQLIKLNKNPKQINHLIFFSKDELKSILQLYSIQVANGILKDYAIDYGKKLAVFSFYRHTYDKPLFEIEKYTNKKNKFITEFIVKYNKKIIEKSKSLNIILNRLEKKFSILKLN